MYCNYSTCHDYPCTNHPAFVVENEDMHRISQGGVLEPVSLAKRALFAAMLRATAAARSHDCKEDLNYVNIFLFQLLHMWEAADIFRPIGNFLTPDKPPVIVQVCVPVAKRNSVSELNTEEAQVLVLSALNSCLNTGVYDSRIRNLIRELLPRLGLTWEWFVFGERQHAALLMSKIGTVDPPKSKGKTLEKWLKVGAVSLLGGALVAGTGGLAGPALGVALHSLGAVSASTCAFLAGSTGVAMASVAVGSWGTKATLTRMETLTADLEDFTLKPSEQESGSALHVVLFVNGWLQREVTHVEDKAEAEMEDEYKSSIGFENLLGVHESNKDQTPSATAFMPGKEEKTSMNVEEKISTVVEEETLTTSLQEGKKTGWTSSGLSFAGSALKLTGSALKLTGSVLKTVATNTGSALQNVAAGARDSVVATAKEGQEVVGRVGSKVSSVALPELGVGETHPWHAWTQVQKSSQSESYLLMWASQQQLRLGHVVSDFVRKKLKKKALGYAIGRTILGGLWASISMPKAVMQFYEVIDNPWSVVMARTEQAASSLALLLSAKVHGSRPISLVGFSCGARVIFRALEILAEAASVYLPVAAPVSSKPAEDTRATTPLGPFSPTHIPSTLPQNECRGIVFDVYLIGTPVPADPSRWNAIRGVIGGRLVNCYSRSDLMIKILSRHGLAAIPEAAVAPVESVFVENFDVSLLAPSHSAYYNSDTIAKVLHQARAIF